MLAHPELLPTADEALAAGGERPFEAQDLGRAEDGVLLHTVGVGTSSGANIIDPDTRELKRNQDGTPVVSKLNEKELMDLAITGNGSYQLLADTDIAVEKIIKEIDGMEKKTIKDNSLLSYRSFFPWFLGLAALLLVLELFYPERKTHLA